MKTKGSSMKMVMQFILTIVALTISNAEGMGDGNELKYGAIVRTDRTKKEIHLVFTGHHFADGGMLLRKCFKRHHVKASFFFTGDFYRNPDFTEIIKGLRKDGHYLGGHSDKHIRYALSECLDSTLITKEEFMIDIENNYAAMAKFGIRRNDAPFFLPPFEVYNQTITERTKEAGLTLINFTPGTMSNQDYSIPSMGQEYAGSDRIYESIIGYEKSHKDGLNGFILLCHIGTEPDRTDKFYSRMDTMITELEGKGYRFTLLNSLLGQK